MNRRFFYYIKTIEHILNTFVVILLNILSNKTNAKKLPLLILHWLISNIYNTLNVSPKHTKYTPNIAYISLERIVWLVLQNGTCQDDPRQGREKKDTKVI